MKNARNEKSRRATLYRMVLPDHVCPFGLKARELLSRDGFAIDEHLLTTREQTDAFKREHGLATTPLVFIGDERIGGADDLERWLARQR